MRTKSVLKIGLAALLLPVGVTHAWRASWSPEEEIAFHQELSWSPDSSRIAFSAVRFSVAEWERKKWDVFNETGYDVYVVGVDGSMTTRLTEHPGHDVWTSWSPDGTKIVFSSDRGGNADLYIMDLRDSSLTRLTADPAKESGPAWSPDGLRIAFTSKRNDHSQIYVIHSDGSSEVKISSGPANHWNPVWSPDGTRLLYYSDREGSRKDQVYVVNADGSGQVRLTTTGHNVWPSWSPDAGEILFGRDGAVFSMNADGSGARRLIEKASFARWSPDGSRIAFIARVSADRPETRIYVAKRDGTERTLLAR